MKTSEVLKAYSVYADISYAEAERRYKVLKQFIFETLDAGESIELLGLMNIYTKVLPAQTYRNPKTGEPVYKDERLKTCCDLAGTLENRYKGMRFSRL